MDCVGFTRPDSQKRLQRQNGISTAYARDQPRQADDTDRQAHNNLEATDGRATCQAFAGRAFSPEGGLLA